MHTFPAEPKCTSVYKFDARRALSAFVATKTCVGVRNGHNDERAPLLNTSSELFEINLQQTRFWSEVYKVYKVRYFCARFRAQEQFAHTHTDARSNMTWPRIVHLRPSITARVCCVHCDGSKFEQIKCAPRTGSCIRLHQAASSCI